jgi:hypothetical protein
MKAGFVCRLLSERLKKNWWRLLALPNALFGRAGVGRRNKECVLAIE